MVTQYFIPLIFSLEVSVGQWLIFVSFIIVSEVAVKACGLVNYLVFRVFPIVLCVLVIVEITMVSVLCSL